jgi:phage terminase large subunit-like protein
LAEPTVIDLTDFRPTQTQWAFLTDRTPVRAMIGGVGSGKTRTLMEAAVDAALENPGCDGMLVSPTFPMLWRTLIPTWEKACPPELRPQHLKGERRYVLAHGGSVWYGTAKDPDTLEGTNLAWYAGDEARYWPRKSHQNMLARRRDARARRPQAIYSTTPGFGWLAAASVSRDAGTSARMSRTAAGEATPGSCPACAWTRVAATLSAAACNRATPAL